MTKGIRSLVGIVLVFSLLLSGVGYATLTDSLQVTGSANAEAPETLYIYDVQGATVGWYSELTVTLSDVPLVWDADAGKYAAEIDVSFFNNTPAEYMYYGLSTKLFVDGAITDTTSFSAELLDYTIANDGEGGNKGTTVPISEKQTGKLRIETDSSTLTDAVIVFNFKPSSEYNGWEKVVDIYDHFGNILNDETLANELLDEMQNGYNVYDLGSLGGILGTLFAGRSGKLIGNVPGSTDADSALIDRLFTVDGKNLLHQTDEDGNVIYDENGDPVTTTVLIYASDLDNNDNTGITIENAIVNWGVYPENGCEMTIFMIPDEINNSISSVTAFAMLYGTDDKGTSWYQVGQLFAGTADTDKYAGLVGNNKTSIDPDSWLSSAAYDPDNNAATNNSVASGSTAAAIYTAYLPYANKTTAAALIVRKKEYI